MKTYNGLPLYKMTIDENDSISGIEFISLVDQPAIEVNWVAMDSNKRKVKFNEDQQIITGPAMIPDLPIYRFDEQLGEYYVMFSVDECKRIMRKFLKEGRTLGFNYMHKTDSQVATAQLDELWYIKDKDNDYSKALGYDLPIGTPMVTTYIADKEFWNKEVKSGNVRGFSIEGYLNLEMSKIKNKIQNAKMNKVKFEAEIKTADGVVLYTPQDSFIVDSEVYTVDAEGNQTAALDGDYVLENGSTITVLAGKITVVAEAVAQEQTEEFALTPEETQVLIDAVLGSDMIKELMDRIAKLEEANTAMATAMSKIPGAPSVTATTTVVDDKDKPKGKMSLFDKVEKLRSLKK